MQSDNMRWIMLDRCVVCVVCCVRRFLRRRGRSGKIAYLGIWQARLGRYALNTYKLVNELVYLMFVPREPVLCIPPNK
jgi:hypothetical protein